MFVCYTQNFSAVRKLAAVHVNATAERRVTVMGFYVATANSTVAAAASSSNNSNNNNNEGSSDIGAVGRCSAHHFCTHVIQHST
jgi:hypothetical protein